MAIRIDEGPSKTNLTAGTNPLSLYLPTISSDIYGAKGNSGDMVIKDINGSIDARKYLTKMRYGFNDQGKLDMTIERNL